ncbi:MAG: dihydroxy-acid dehydratase [Actinomycetota bacterium]|nr:dihydroxy-acid dehydratase [Actinomycetota bacterium]
MTFGGIYSGLTSYGDAGFSRYMRNAFLRSAGLDPTDLDRPIVGIADTSSGYTTCHREMPQMIKAIERGVLQSGALPVVFPTMSLAETLLSPTSMFLRNLMAMETEELINCQPMDAVVLAGGCDKTVPAQLMAAISADVPAISAVTGPMLAGHWRGQRLGACTDCRGNWAEYRAGQRTQAEIAEVESNLCATAGTCPVMGTASTMACITEAMGLTLPGSATAPSSSGARLQHCVAIGRQAASLAKCRGPRPKDMVTRGSIRNALVILSALGGSTNAVIHLLAIARRAGIDLDLQQFDSISREVPVLVDCKPAGAGYIEDFHNAGGVPALMKELEPLLALEAMTVSGSTVGDLLADTDPPQPWQSTIRTLEDPLHPPGGLAVLRGSLVPDGAVLKVSAASPDLLNHRGPAIVFDDAEAAGTVLNDPDREIDPDSVIVLRNMGPVGGAMPESSALPIPKKLAKEGVRDMVRISDGRMSGTAYGTVILHSSPESAVGGPLALVRTGDVIELNTEERRLDLLVDEDELNARREQFDPPPLPDRGWSRLYASSVLPAHLGADLDFMTRDTGSENASS